MAVMNGFRNQLYEKILGLNGHAIVQPVSGTGPFENFGDVAARLEAVPGVRHAIPLIEGQVMVSSPIQALGGLVRGMTEKGIRSLPLVADNIVDGSLEGFDNQKGIAIGTRLAQALGVSASGEFALRWSRHGARERHSGPRLGTRALSSIRVHCLSLACPSTTGPWCSCRLA